MFSSPAPRPQPVMALRRPWTVGLLQVWTVGPLDRWTFYLFFILYPKKKKENRGYVGYAGCAVFRQTVSSFVRLPSSRNPTRFQHCPLGPGASAEAKFRVGRVTVQSSTVVRRALCMLESQNWINQALTHLLNYKLCRQSLTFSSCVGHSRVAPPGQEPALAVRHSRRFATPTTHRHGVPPHVRQLRRL